MRKNKRLKEKFTLPILVDDYVDKITTFNGGEIFFLFKADKKVKEEWKKRITCNLCFCRRFFESNGIDTYSIPYRVYLCPSFTEVKSLIFEKSEQTFNLQPNAASAVIRGSLFAHQKASPIMDTHEFTHILTDNIQMMDNQKTGDIPMWLKEGTAQYIQGKKNNVDYLELARNLEYLPPITLKDMNIPTEKFWLEFGIMDQLVLTGNHPGLTACASFVQFLVEKEGVDFKEIWNLMFSTGSFQEFYKKIEKLCKRDLFNIINNYLYYIDKPFLERGQTSWEMPVATARDFRGKLHLEKQQFKFFIHFDG